jgi:hypothetical protein
MGLKRQIETLKEWACEKAKQDCYYCEYSIRDDVIGSVCPFYEVIKAAEDRKEGTGNDKS